MGAFPSHDSPELIYTTLVSHPTTESQVEVCLVPLLPRFFNDGHKKVKKKLNDLLARRNPSPVPGVSLASPGKRGEHSGNSAIVDYIISGTEAFFFVNTKDAVSKLVDEPKEKPLGLGAAGEGADSGSASAVGPTSPTSMRTTPTSAARSPVHSVPAYIRPVPFAVCILEPESTNESSGGNFHGGKQHHPQGNAGNNNNSSNTVVIKGRRVQLVGFIASCMGKKVHHLNISTGAKGHGMNGSVVGGGGSATGSLNAGEGKKPIPVVLDLIFDDKNAHGYLSESVLLLASLAFRKQFVNSCALYYPAGDEQVESAFDSYMERLQLSVILRHNDYRALRLFHTHYPLVEMISDLRSKSSASTAQFSLYENHQGEHGIEVTFHRNFLSSWMRYIEKFMRVDSVNGYHVRCTTRDMLQERDRLLQERQDSGAFLEEEEDECTFGGAIYLAAMKQWLRAASHAVLKHAAPPVGAPMMMYPTPGYWPGQMPVVMGEAPGWPAGGLPAYGAVPPMAMPQSGVPAQQPQIVCIPTPTPQMYANTPAYVPATGRMPMVAQPNPFPIAAPPAGGQQQFVYVLPQGPPVPQQTAAPQVYFSQQPTSFPAVHPYAGFQQATAPR